MKYFLALVLILLATVVNSATRYDNYADCASKCNGKCALSTEGGYYCTSTPSDDSCSGIPDGTPCYNEGKQGTCKKERCLILAAATATKSCSQYTSEDSCNLAANCIWENKTCHDNLDECSGYTDAISCNADSDCTWKNNSCKEVIGRSLNGYSNDNCDNRCTPNQECSINDDGKYYCVGKGICGLSCKPDEECRLVNGTPTCVSLPDKYPKQVRLPFRGYFILFGSMLLIFIILAVWNKLIRKKDALRMGFPSIVFASVLVPGTILLFIESGSDCQFYMPPLRGRFMLPLTEFLLLICTVVGFYAFLISKAWSIYKLKTKGEITPFMWTLMKLKDEIEEAGKIRIPNKRNRKTK